jgi:putative ubiquitin-RnfH superfamily antitoxin RatB of RatAB toxin-antitoxin module
MASAELGDGETPAVATSPSRVATTCPAADAVAPVIAVEVVYAAAPHQISRVELTLAPGSTVADALAASGLAAQVVSDDAGRPRVGVWGRLAALDASLRERDRVEIYRPLQVDPKEARRQRYRRDKSKPVR